VPTSSCPDRPVRCRGRHRVAVPTTAPVQVLVGAVHEVLAGRSAMHVEEQAVWLDIDRTRRAEHADRRRRLDTLTDREFTILQLLERGKRAADITKDAVVAMSTVRTQIHAILGKLDVNSQEEATALYREARRRGE